MRSQSDDASIDDCRHGEAALILALLAPEGGLQPRLLCQLQYCSHRVARHIVRVDHRLQECLQYLVDTQSRCSKSSLLTLSKVA